MTYVISDPHGCFDLWQEMMKEINFGKDDTMFVLGDIVDFGEQPMDLLCELSYAENIWPVAGEHDRLAWRMLSGFEKMLSSGEKPDEEYVRRMQAWMSAGGNTTLEAFRALDAEMREGVIEYLEDMPMWEQVSAGDREWLLLHSGICGYKKGKDIDDYDEADFFGPEPVRKFPGVTLVCGHLPTTENYDCDGRIYYGDGFIDIDCGAGRGGRLACLRLEDGAEFYV